MLALPHAVLGVPLATHLSLFFFLFSSFFFSSLNTSQDFSGGPVVKNSPSKAGDADSQKINLWPPKGKGEGIN